MKIDFEYLYGETPFVCRTCCLDCLDCPYGADIFILAKADDLLLKKHLREQEIRRAKKALEEINRDLERLKLR